MSEEGQANTNANTPPAAQENKDGKSAINILVVGMAGSGKTTFMQRIASYLYQTKQASYIINLDPAVTHLPYGANIDIRESVNYREVMKQYTLGPNGAILTSLNLFSTRFDQVLSFVENRKKTVKYVLVDTPGQIEVFNWSASGTIITESLASVNPTVMLYIVDTPRSASPSTFMSNMLYACSILYKSKLPLIVVFNKVDVVRHDFAVEWMTDFDKFDEATDNETNFMSSLTRSMSLMLEEFYKNMRVVGFSALTGEGVDDLFKAIEEAAVEYENDYKVEYEKNKEKQKAAEELRKQESLEKFRKDLEAGKDTKSAAPPEIDEELLAQFSDILS